MACLWAVVKPRGRGKGHLAFSCEKNTVFLVGVWGKKCRHLSRMWSEVVQEACAGRHDLGWWHPNLKVQSGSQPHILIWGLRKKHSSLCSALQTSLSWAPSTQYGHKDFLHKQGNSEEVSLWSISEQDTRLACHPFSTWQVFFFLTPWRSWRDETYLQSSAQGNHLLQVSLLRNLHILTVLWFSIFISLLPLGRALGMLYLILALDKENPNHKWWWFHLCILN